MQLTIITITIINNYLYFAWDLYNFEFPKENRSKLFWVLTRYIEHINFAFCLFDSKFLTTRT